MKPFKALKYLISRKNSAQKEKSKNISQSQDKSSINNQTAPSEEKFFPKTFASQIPTQGQEYLNHVTMTEKEGDMLFLTENQEILAKDGQIDTNNSKYSKNLGILIGSLKEIVRGSDALRENQRNIMNLFGVKFQNLENVIKHVVGKSKSLKKKYEEIFDLTAIETLTLTNKIYSSLFNPNSNEILKQLDSLKFFFSEEIKTLSTLNKETKCNNGDNDIMPLKTGQNKKLRPKKNIKTLSSTIMHLDSSMKKKFLISIQDKLKQKKIAENQKSPENIDFAMEESPQIKIINSNSERMLENGLFLKKASTKSLVKDEESNDTLMFNNETDYRNDDRSRYDKENESSHLFTPEQERKIILGLMKNEYGYSAEQNCFINKAENGKENQVKFLVNANWWRTWTTYVDSEIKMYPGEIKNKYSFFKNRFFIDNKHFFLLFIIYNIYFIYILEN